MKSKFKWTLLVWMITSMAALAGCSPAQPAVPSAAQTLPLETCWLSQEGLSVQVQAQCGTLEVPEDPAVPSGRQISLRVAVIPAQSRTPSEDPLFLLAGGPGQAASEAFLPLISALNRANFKRDLVMVDQRGSGASAPLKCDIPENDQDGLRGEMPDLADYQQWAADCRANLNADPQFYTSMEAIHDLEAVRQALGYDQINLLGVSYGTRTAQLYQQNYPQNVRTMILDGVVPANWPIGSKMVEDAQRALDINFDRCKQQEGCQQAFPDIKTEFETLLSQLDSESRQVSLPHPLTGENVSVSLTAEGVSSTIRLMSYNHLTAALVPLVIHQAQTEGNWQPLAAQYLIITESLGRSIHDGLYYAVMCSEDIPFFNTQPAEDAGYLRSTLQYTQALCQEWGLPADPVATSLPPASNVPTLLISGEADPVTPPANGDAAAVYLPNSLHLVMPEMGHNNFAEGCLPLVIRDFLQSGAVQGLDTACISQIKAAPFFVHPSGPRP